MTEAKIKLECRLLAIEYLLGNLFVHFYKAIKVSDAEVEQADARFLELMRQEKFHAPDPVLSDLWAGEIHDAVSRLLSMIDEMRKAGKTPA